MIPAKSQSTSSQNKRAAILEQAIRVFAEFGFRNTDVQVIADRAGVGKGTVYRYFGNKEKLFWTCTMEVVKRLDAFVQGKIAGAKGALAKLRAAGLAYAEFFQSAPHYLEMLIQERAEFRGSVPPEHVEFHEQLIDRYSRIISDGIAAGEIRPVNVRQVVLAIAAFLFGTVVHSGYVTQKVSLTQAADFGLDLLLRGLQATPAD